MRAGLLQVGQAYAAGRPDDFREYPTAEEVVVLDAQPQWRATLDRRRGRLVYEKGGQGVAVARRTFEGWRPGILPSRDIRMPWAQYVDLFARRKAEESARTEVRGRIRCLLAESGVELTGDELRFGGPAGRLATVTLEAPELLRLAELAAAGHRARRLGHRGLGLVSGGVA